MNYARSTALVIGLGMVALALLLAGGCGGDNGPSGPSGPTVVLSVDSLWFQGEVQSQNQPGARIIYVTLNGATDLDYSVDNSRPQDSTWLHWSTLGDAPDSIIITASTDGLLPGMYYDTLVITASGAANSPLRFAATMLVGHSLRVSPIQLIIVSPAETASQPAETLLVNNVGSQPIAYTATENADWITLDPVSGQTPTKMAVNYSTVGLSQGVISTSITIESAEAFNTVTIPCSLLVQSWTDLTGSSTLDYTGVDFVDADRGWISAAGYGGVENRGAILHTTNGGADLTPVFAYTVSPGMTRNFPPLSAIWFGDAATGFAVGDSGTVFRSMDGGLSWEIRPTLQDTAALWNVAFVDLGTGWAFGKYGTILSTTDSGETWQTQTSPVTFSLATGDFIDAQTGWITGNAGYVLHTTDAGQNWGVQARPGAVNLWGIDFASADSGWVVGDGGLVARTIDGGDNWELLSSGVTVTLRDVVFVDNRQGWAVGDDGVVIVTINGGDSWQKQITPISGDLEDAMFIDPTTGWAVGFEGLLIRTASSGP